MLLKTDEKDNSFYKIKIFQERKTLKILSYKSTNGHLWEIVFAPDWIIKE